jgi:hypothetical protein
VTKFYIKNTHNGSLRFKQSTFVNFCTFRLGFIQLHVRKIVKLFLVDSG